MIFFGFYICLSRTVSVETLAVHTTTLQSELYSSSKIHARRITLTLCECVRSVPDFTYLNYSLIFATVLEQVNADLVLTSSRADDDFIDALNEYSMDPITFL